MAKKTVASLEKEIEELRGVVKQLEQTVNNLINIISFMQNENNRRDRQRPTYPWPQQPPRIDEEDSWIKPYKPIPPITCGNNGGII